MASTAQPRSRQVRPGDAPGFGLEQKAELAPLIRRLAA